MHFLVNIEVILVILDRLLLIDAKEVNTFLSLLVGSQCRVANYSCSFLNVLAPFVLKIVILFLPFFWGVLLWTHEFLFVWCFTLSHSHSLWYASLHCVPELASGSMFTCLFGTAPAGCGCFPCFWPRQNFTLSPCAFPAVNLQTTISPGSLGLFD